MMHTETYLTPTEEYIARNRAAIAILGAGLISALLILAWGIILPLFGIVSANMVAAGGIIISLGMAIAALGWYWAEA